MDVSHKRMSSLAGRRVKGNKNFNNIFCSGKLYTQGTNVISHFHGTASWRLSYQELKKKKKFFPYFTVPAIISAFGEVHFQNLLTSSWQGLVLRLDENFLQ